MNDRAFVLFIFIALVLLFYLPYQVINLSNHSSIYFVFTIYIIVLIFIIIVLKNVFRSYKLKRRNRILIDKSLLYETKLKSECRKNHDTKNNLIMIRSMVDVNNSDLINFIDSIENFNFNSEEITHILNPLKNLSFSRFITSKILEGEEKFVFTTLRVKSETSLTLKKNDFHNTVKIIGIILDNAYKNSTSGVIFVDINNHDLEFSITVSNDYKMKSKYKNYIYKNGHGLITIKNIVKKSLNLSQTVIKKCNHNEVKITLLKSL